jgi:hypothetical protein
VSPPIIPLFNLSGYQRTFGTSAALLSASALLAFLGWPMGLARQR